MLKDKNYGHRKNFSMQNQNYSLSSKCCLCQQCSQPLCPPKPPKLFSGGIQVQLQNAAHALAVQNRAIIFDTIIQSNSDIIYDSTIGKFILPSTATYFISWWAAVDGTETTAMIDFAVAVDDTTISIGSSPQVTCQISGSAFVPVGVTPARLSVMNVSGNAIRFANTSVQANIVILKLTS